MKTQEEKNNGQRNKTDCLQPLYTWRYGGILHAGKGR